MENTKRFKCLFDVTGGECGEADDVLEAEFELTDEEYQQALRILEENDRHLSADLPYAMYITIWQKAHKHLDEQLKKLVEKYPDEYSEDDYLGADTDQLIYNINNPEPIG